MLKAVLPMAVGPTIDIKYLFVVLITCRFFKKCKGKLKNQIDQLLAC